MGSVKTVRLSSLRRAAAKLKRDAARADLDGDGRLSANEIRKFTAGRRNGYRTGRALLTMQSWALRDLERASSAAVGHVQQKIDESMALATGRDADHSGTIDSGTELSSAKRLKTFQALAELAGYHLSGTLDAQALTAVIDKYSTDAWYISESDYHPKTFVVPLAGAANAKNVVTALQSTLTAFYDAVGYVIDPRDFAFEASSASDSQDFIDSLAAGSSQGSSLIRKSNAAFRKINSVVRTNLDGVRVIKYGPKDPATGQLASDKGLYVQIVVGRSSDGKLAGFLLGDVET